MTRSAARIAELEAEIARLTATMLDHEAEMVPSLTARIAELEAERDRLRVEKKIAVDAGTMVLDEYEKVKARIAELEAERDAFAGVIHAKAARIAELEAERDRLSIAAILALGRMEYEKPDGWHAVDLGLRGEVIEAALKIRPTEKLHDALLAGGAVVFQDDALKLLVRWSPE